MVFLVAVLAVSLAAVSPPQTTPDNPHTRAAAVYVPERVYDTSRRAFSDFEMMLADLARADVIVVGEQHDDPNTHRLEAAVLQGLMRRSVPVTVSFEMFERDVQQVLDDYLAGRIAEEEFLKTSRPWPRYATDYRPLVEMARAHGWPAIAANVPRRYASAVAKEGMAALETLPQQERALAARDVQCPFDRYFERFSETMNAHPTPGSEKQSAEERKAVTERYYFSQCVKDETMAEAIVEVFGRREGRPGAIVHYTGAFHSDFGAGVVERIRRRLPGRRVAIVSMLPVADIDAVEPKDEDLQRADFLVYTVK